MTDEEKPVPEFVRRGLAMLISPQMQGATSAVRRIAGYEPPSDARTPFLDFHQFITAPPPRYITAWRTNPALEHWYKDHVDGILHSAQNALAAAYYHRERIVTMENELVTALQSIDFKGAIPPGSAVGLGGTVRLDFEYQAFVLAARRCLDYLTRGLAAYFQQQFHSFRHMPRALRSFQHSLVAQRLVQVHATHTGNLTFLLTAGQQRSVRDLIAHYRHVDVGALNITKDGFKFVGGGEKLNMKALQGEPVRISQAIDARLAQVQACVADLLGGFVDAARKES